MKVLSLFDGISCGMVALERAGIPVERYVAYEIDKYAIQISEKNYPQIEHCGDVTTADFTQYKGFDLLLGGSPCMHWSIANNGRETTPQGIGWDLFMQYKRALVESGCRYFLYENNFSIHKNIKATISNELGVEPLLIDSADFSAQERKRLYWTNISVNLNYNKSKLVIENILEYVVNEKYYYNCPLTNVDMEKPVCATLEINGYDMLKRVQNKKFKCHTLTACGGGNTQKKVYVNGRARKLTPIEYERLQTLPDNYTAGVSNTQRYKGIGKGWTVDVIAHILKNIPNIYKNGGVTQ